MANLNTFKHLVIDWNLTPEEAVTMYLEWGNNNWHARHKPVRGKADSSTYFVVDNWGASPRVMLIHRDSGEARELANFELPREVAGEFLKEYKGLKGIFAPTPGLRQWLRAQVER
jgi:hypothetical protein